MKKTYIAVVLLAVISLTSCQNENEAPHAFGNFEADETIISSKTQGDIEYLNLDEGMIVEKGDTIAIIDSTQLYLSKLQLIARKEAVSARFPNITAQVEVQKEKLANLEKTMARISEMYDSDAATEQKLDDIKGQVNVVKRNIEAIKTQNKSVFSELEVLDAQIDIINDKISDCIIINPMKGMVLESYVRQYEILGPGKPVYKIANPDIIYLKAYVSGAMLDDVIIGKEATVFIDRNADELRTYDGVVCWVADEAEFTPKTIQTQEERVELVYAVKIRVKNDGRIKIGMPGEVAFVN